MINYSGLTIGMLSVGSVEQNPFNMERKNWLKKHGTGERMMTYDEAYERLDAMVERGEITEEEAREELFFFEAEDV